MIDIRTEKFWLEQDKHRKFAVYGTNGVMFEGKVHGANSGSLILKNGSIISVIDLACIVGLAYDEEDARVS